MTKVIAGFPGVGKSYIAKENTELLVLDSDSSDFSWLEPGVRNPDFPENYIKHIKANIGIADIIMVSTHSVVREALKDADIEYTLVYPNADLKLEYIKRYIKRESPDAFTRYIAVNWNDFMEELAEDDFPTIELRAGEYLKDIIPYLR